MKNIPYFSCPFQEYSLLCASSFLPSASLTEAVLPQSLYESIKTEPFKIPEDDGNDLMHTFFNPDREGWLMKQGGRYKSWKRRWFILNDNCLYYFEYTTDKEPRGIIPLENIEVGAWVVPWLGGSGFERKVMGES